MSAMGYERARPADTVAGFLAAVAIFAASIGVVWHPLRLVPISMLLALLAAAIGGRHQRLAFVATLVTAVCFFVGMAIAVAAETPLW